MQQTIVGCQPPSAIAKHILISSRDTRTDDLRNNRGKQVQGCIHRTQSQGQPLGQVSHPDGQYLHQRS
eukprot:1226873-Amphidinium_carterae.1